MKYAIYRNRDEKAGESLKRTRGFTLIELLVVMSIIALLLALLLPVLSNARQSARLAVCLARNSQIGLAHYLYAGENDDCLVPTQNASGVFWWNSLAPYYDKPHGNNELMYCPEALAQSLHLERPSYGGNRRVAYEHWLAGNIPRLSNLRRETIINIDTNYAIHAKYSASQWMVPGTGWLDTASPPGFVIPLRHLGNPNMLFVDGHAANQTRESIMDAKYWSGY